MAQVTVAVFVTDDDRVSDFAATFDSGKLAAKGCGAATLAAFAKVALASKWSVTSLGGLDAMRRAAAEMEGEMLDERTACHHQRGDGGEGGRTCHSQDPRSCSARPARPAACRRRDSLAMGYVPLLP